MNTLGKPIGSVVGQTQPLEGEHGAGVGVSGGHHPSASNQARGYGGQDSDFNAGLGGEHASGGLPNKHSTPIADKFMGSSHGDSASSDTVSGAYEGGSTRNALTGESNAHTTGAGVGVLGENLHGGQGHSHTARDTALTGTAGAAAATALGTSGAHGTDVGVGAAGGSGGHYATGGHSTTGAAVHNTQHVSAGHDNHNIGTGASAGILGAQQAGARGTHGDSGISSTGTGHSSGLQSGSQVDKDNKRGEPLSDPKDLDSGTRHGLVFDKATGKYEHRHSLEENK